MRTRSPAASGAIAGIIGAATLALFFLAFDLARGAAMRTPAFLAGAIFGRGGVEADLGLIAIYTLIHFALFVLVGVLTAWALDRAGIRPHFLLGLVLGFLLFDLVFYAGVIVTGVNVVRALGWPEVLAGNLLAGVAMLGFLQATAPEGSPSLRESLRLPALVREGVVAGVAAGVAVALWFLIIDAIQGRIFFTPAALGSALLLRAGNGTAVQIEPGIIAAYTAIHFIAFIIVGIIAAAFAHGARREPRVILAAALMFVTFQVFFLGLVAIGASWLLDEMPAWTVVIANLIAAAIIVGYLLHRHPEIREDLRRQDLEEPGYTRR